MICCVLVPLSLRAIYESTTVLHMYSLKICLKIGLMDLFEDSAFVLTSEEKFWNMFPNAKSPWRCIVYCQLHNLLELYIWIYGRHEILHCNFESCCYFFLLSIFLLSLNSFTNKVIVSSLQLTEKNHANFNVIIITITFLVPSVLVRSLTCFPQGFHLRAGHWAIWLAGKMILPSWFDLLEKIFSDLFKSSFQKALPTCKNYLPY